MELKYYIILGVISSLIVILRKKNLADSKNIEKRKAVREKSRKMLIRLNESRDVNHPISKYILKLLENFHAHEKISKTLLEEEIKAIEGNLNLTLPKSYKIFLKYFGDGGNWVFAQSIDSIQKGRFFFEHDFHQQINEYIYLETEKIKTSSLLSLMVEDSNGGAWCWLTHNNEKENEWPLVYYLNNKLYYKVENFTEWMKILVETEGEVIRFLDTEEKLGLG